MTSPTLWIAKAAASSSKPEASATMPAKPRVNETNFHVLKRSVPNETSCPSLASDVSSKGSDSIEPSNAEHERRVTIALKPGGLLDIDRPDRLIIWSRWLEDEPNPVYGHGAVERRRHWNDLFGALSLQCEKFEVEYMKDSGRVDGPSPQAINGDEPVDGGVRKRGIGTGQIPTNVRNTSEIRSPKNRLSDDIISPKGSDKARLLLGFGVFDAWEEEWDFMCYLFKRHPTEHEECAGFHVQEERSVRTNHAWWHKERGDITQETYEHIKYLERYVGAELSHLHGREKGVAMWREGYIVVFPDHKVVKHLLNPSIGALFNLPKKAMELLQAGDSCLAKPVPALPASPFQNTEQDKDTTAQTSQPNVNPAGSGAQADTVAQGQPSPAHGWDVTAMNASRPPFAMNSDPAQPVLSSIDGIPQPETLVVTILTRLGQVAERVEHDLGTNRVIFHLPPPIDPQLDSTPSNALPAARDVHEALPIVSEPHPQPSPRNARIRTQDGAIRGDSRRIVRRAPCKRSSQPASRARATREQTRPPSQSVPSLTTDNTNTSGLLGPATASEPCTPPRIEADSPSPQARQLILVETSQQDKAPAESENEEVASSYVSDTFLTMFDPNHLWD